MADPLLIRAATPADAPFLVEAICEAEKGGTECLSYCRIFDFDETEFKQLLLSMLDEDIDGQELCIADFLVAERSGRLLGACCAWIEGAGGHPSALLKASLLVHAVDAQRMRAAQQHFKKLEKLYIMRDEGALQIESVYVHPAGRGEGLAAQLIAAQLDRLAGKATAGHAQIILASINDAAKATYANCGFSPTRTVSSTDAELLQLVPSLEKLLMQRPLSGVNV